MLKQQEYNEHAVACFFTALRLHAAYGPFLMPHLLAILAHNSYANPSPLHPVVKEELQQGLPAQVLLPHISHLVEGLTRGERDIAKWLVRHVATSFPQAAYCPLRVGVYHARDSVQRWIKDHENAGESDSVRFRDYLRLNSATALSASADVGHCPMVDWCAACTVILSDCQTSGICETCARVVERGRVCS